ncbi:MAG: chemotaxis protein CheW [Spirochaetota bacterium]|nr:chemotaxis protein CheW [Spirochaetota bacterium]
MSSSDIIESDDYVLEIDSNVIVTSSEEELETIDILIFKVNDRELGFQNNGIYEILKPQKITPVPFTEDFVLGLMNVRGEIISCIDCGLFLFSEWIEIGEKSRIILIGNGEITTGILVSSIIGIEQIQVGAMEKFSESGGGLIVEFIQWIMDTEERSLVVLAIDKIINSERLRSYEKR